MDRSGDRACRTARSDARNMVWNPDFGKEPLPDSSSRGRIEATSWWAHSPPRPGISPTHRVGAELKPRPSAGSRGQRAGLPDSSSRGRIEAGRPSASSRPSRPLPDSSSRGRIEAGSGCGTRGTRRLSPTHRVGAELKHLAGDPVEHVAQGLPDSSSRGRIEAWRSPCPGRCDPTLSPTHRVGAELKREGVARQMVRSHSPRLIESGPN